MKKLMIAALAALATVGAAQAAQSYGIKAEGYVSPYSKDTAPDASHAGWYSLYVMKQSDAQTAMGTTEAVTYEGMATWLSQNFADNKASVIANAEQIPFTAYTYGQYCFSKAGGYGSGLNDALGVFFYEDTDKNVAYNVMRSGTVTGQTFSVDDGCIPVLASGWTAVPEPTSGLLLLLGVAGLALKRKRA